MNPDEAICEQEGGDALLTATSSSPSHDREHIDKVLRFWQAGFTRPVWPYQGNRCRTVSAAKGNALNQRPCVVAEPLWSEWRNRCPSERN